MEELFMFNFNADGKNFLYLDLLQTVELLVALSVIVILASMAVIIYCTNRSKFRRFLKIAVVAVLVFSAAIITLNIVIAARDGDLSTSYQLYLTIGIFLALFALSAVILTRRDKRPLDAKALAYAAVCLSLAYALSYIRLFRMPQAGSVTLASVMLLGLYSYMFGVKRGLIACFVYGLLQSLQDPWIVHPLQYILDYPVAYMMFGLVGAFKNRLKNIHISLAVGFAIAVVLRFCCHFLSGALFFEEYATDAGMNVWAYSALYNVTVLIDGAVALVITLASVSSRQVRVLLAAPTAQPD
jgi:thiamine transporter